MSKGFWVSVHVLLLQKLNVSGQEVAGYYQNYGLNAEDAGKVKEQLEAIITDGKIDWTESEILALDLISLDRKIASQYRKDTYGIWYSSGRIFYSDE